MNKKQISEDGDWGVMDPDKMKESKHKESSKNIKLQHNETKKAEFILHNLKCGK